MILSFILAALTGYFVHKKWWGAATFTGMIFFAFLWGELVMVLNMMFVGKSMGF